jgi:hypothetical protein
MPKRIFNTKPKVPTNAVKNRAKPPIEETIEKFLKLKEQGRLPKQKPDSFRILCILAIRKGFTPEEASIIANLVLGTKYN